ncbi:hypothetical protein B0I66_003212 [Clostridium beijerinckii]|nr:hypothetical protein [Clostridium beijerinckii]NRT84049.1 hypothetical protein [Clostridium beijerinckii]
MDSVMKEAFNDKVVVKMNRLQMSMVRLFLLMHQLKIQKERL